MNIFFSLRWDTLSYEGYSNNEIFFSLDFCMWHVDKAWLITMLQKLDLIMKMLFNMWNISVINVLQCSTQRNALAEKYSMVLDWSKCRVSWVVIFMQKISRIIQRFYFPDECKNKCAFRIHKLTIQRAIQASQRLLKTYYHRGKNIQLYLIQEECIVSKNTCFGND